VRVRVKAFISWWRVRTEYVLGEAEGEHVVICLEDTLNTSDEFNIFTL
jgi:hypothetical protein